MVKKNKQQRIARCPVKQPRGFKWGGGLNQQTSSAQIRTRGRLRLLIEKVAGRCVGDRKLRRSGRGEQGNEQRLRRATIRQGCHRGRHKLGILELRAVSMIQRCCRFVGRRRTVVMAIMAVGARDRMRIGQQGRATGLGNHPYPIREPHHQYQRREGNKTLAS